MEENRMDRVKGKVAIITGSARGLGKAQALLLSKEGAKVVVTDLAQGEDVAEGIRRGSLAELEAVAAELRADHGVEALALALDEARSGQLDSAAARLWSPLLSEAMADTLPPERRRRYPWEREQLWVNGWYDGWPWYIARARAEVAASLGRWPQALEAARACVAARPLAGKEWLAGYVQGLAAVGKTVVVATNDRAEMDWGERRVTLSG